MKKIAIIYFIIIILEAIIISLITKSTCVYCYGAKNYGFLNPFGDQVTCVELGCGPHIGPFLYPFIDLVIITTIIFIIIAIIIKLTQKK